MTTGQSPPEWIKAPDTKTGRMVWQITSANAVSEAPYFESQGFTADERYLVFRSEREGVSRLYRCELASGELQCLSPDEVGPYRFSMHPDGRRCLYWTGTRLRSVDVATLACRTEAEVTAFTTAQDAFCAGGVAVPAASYRTATVVGNPAGVLMLAIDLDSGIVRPVLQWYAFSHPLVCPGDPDLITFVPSDNACWKMEWPQHLRTRTWAVRVSDGIPRRFITPPPGRTVTHESWSPDGKRMIYFEKAGGAWTPVRIRSVSRQGDDVCTHFESDEYRLGHGVLSPDQRYFVSDVQNAHDSPLLLIDMRTGGHEILCWPDASNDRGHPACAHVHPSFSPRGRYVAFTSDKTGVPQVYIMPLDP